MHRFTIKRKISDTLLGATYECSYNAPPPPPPLIDRSPTRSHRPRASIALKCSSLASHKRVETMLTEDKDQGVAVTIEIDDPRRERVVVAALIASGGHDHVLQCYDQFVTTDDNDDECVCIVTEYCNGGDLFSYRSASTRHGVGESEAISLMLQVARGVVFLHTRLGFAHRDLSLENILLRDGVCKIADFGLATPLGEKCFGCVGKYPYMAPEVVSSLSKDNDRISQGYDPAATDVWSLGVMLFILLTGSPLVDLASRDDPRYAALRSHGLSALLTAWEIDVSHGLVELMDAMLREDPTHRPSVSRVVLSLRDLEVDASAVAERRSSL